MIKIQNSSGETVLEVESKTEKTVSLALKFNEKSMRILQAIGDLKSEGSNMMKSLPTLNKYKDIDNTPEALMSMEQKDLENYVDILKMQSQIPISKLAIMNDVLDLLGLTEQKEDFTFPQINKLYQLLEADMANSFSF